MKTKKTIPPKLAQRFLNWFLRDDLGEEVQGDLEEQFYRKLEESTLFQAKLNYWFQVINYLRPFAISKSNRTRLIQYAMFHNYFKVGWRNLSRKPSYAFINIIGLSIGLASVMLIALHVKQELSYDRHFTKSDRIFRITNENLGFNTRHWAATAPQLGPEMEQTLPEVEYSARLQRPYPYQLLSYVQENGDNNQYEEREGFFADPEVIEMFDLQFIQGNPVTALNETNTIVLTEQMAQKYFGNENPLGKTIIDTSKGLAFQVTGIIKNFDHPTHLQFDYLISMATIDKYQSSESLDNRSWAGFYTYVLLKDQDMLASIQSKMTDFMVDFYKPTGETRDESIASRRFNLQPITDIHLKSKLEKEMSANSDIIYVYIFSSVAILILILATVNFININTTQSFDRLKEVGLRKVIGASKIQVAQQFFFESFIICLLATLVALILFRLVTPYYEALSAKQIRIPELLTPTNLAFLLLLLCILSIIAGIFPALIVTKAQLVSSMKKRTGRGLSFGSFRSSLIVFQFVIAVFMIVSSIVIYSQLNLFHNKNLGFDKEQLIAVTMYPEMQDNLDALTNKLAENPAIENYSMASRIPGQRIGTESFYLFSNSEDPVFESSARLMWADDQYLSTLGMHLKEGSNFTDTKQRQFILNNTAVKEFDIKSPVGSSMAMGGNKGEIVGVVDDFNFASLHSGIEPLVIQYSPYPSSYLFVKIAANQVPHVLQFLKNNISSISPDCLFSFSFVDDNLEVLYRSENKMSSIFKAFTALSILISCLGLYSLSAYSAKVRTKEIGIRKVLGASATSITELLLKDFIKLVFIAGIVATPVVYFVMQRWLQNFSYHIGIQWWIFAFAFLLILSLAILTIGFQSLRAALANPVNSIRSE